MPETRPPPQEAADAPPKTAVALRHQIQEGALTPGEWLREARLCSEYSVGRSIVRTALRTLADDGLVNIEENRGAYVAATTVQEVFDLYEVRAALYGLAARFACIRATPPFMAETLELVDELIAASERGEAAEAARNILYYMQNQAMRLMIARGYGLQPALDVRPARARRAST